MTMQQAGTVIGGIVGYFFGYPQLGLLVGSLIGAALTPKEKTEGPRIDDQKVTVSTYGAGIPTVYGTVRLGGNVVDSTDKIELPFTDSQGGKGGGVENTSYRYFVHMRHVLCATPLDGSEVAIRKIWQDGKLIYDVSSGTSVGSALATAESPYSNLILYQGHEDQMPDGIEELYHGVGNVPAYRGVVSVRLNIIECPGGRVPQFSFELSNSATEITTVSTMCAAPDALGIHGYFVPDGVWHYSYETPGTGNNTLVVSRGGPGYMMPAGRIALPFAAGGARHDFVPVPCPGSPKPTVLRTKAEGDQVTCSIEDISLETGDLTTIYRYTKLSSEYVLMSSSYSSCARDPISGKYVILGGFTTDMTQTPKVIVHDETGIGDGAMIDCDPLVGATGPVAIYNDLVHAATVVGGFVQIESRSASSGATVGSPVVGPAIASAQISKAALYATSQGLFVYLNDESNQLNRIYRVDGLGTGSPSWVFLFSANTVGNYAFSSGNMYASNDLCIVGPSFTTTPLYSILKKGLDIDEVSVADVIAEQCSRAGMESSEYDVSSVTNTVWGYTLTNPASARSNIQPLMTAFAVDATEEDGKIRFFHRSDLASVGTVAFDELASAEDGNDSGDPMPLTRAQEAELPRSVSVSYINKDFDYQTGTEKAIRQITQSLMDSTIELPLSVDSDVAATVAQRVLYDAWNERGRRSFRVSRKFAYVSAGDVLTFEYPRGTFSDWRVSKVTDTGILIEGECVPANGEIYEQTAIGASGYAGQIVAPIVAPTRLQLLDIPILRDSDNNAGIYAAMDSFGDGPTAAELLVGDDDNTLTPRGTVSSSAPIGFVESVPSAWSRRMVDETNIFTVSLGDDVFNSVTRDVLLANGGEFWALGAPGRWEIGCSALGSSIGAGRFILSRHLRGLFGTEQYTGTHVVGDTFVLLRIAGMLRPTMGVGELGQVKSYRAVSKGRSVDSAASQTYANTGEGLEPLSPINLRRTSTNALTVDRRSRLSMNNNTGTVPLGENIEGWSWAFYTSGAFTTLLGTVATSTATVTAAQMTSAGVTPTATLFVRVAQLSDSVGLGHQLQATV